VASSGWSYQYFPFLFAGTTIISPDGLVVYNGTPAAGNQVAAIAGMSFTDQFGNVIPQALSVWATVTGFHEGQNAAIFAASDTTNYYPAAIDGNGNYYQLGSIYRVLTSASPITQTLSNLDGLSYQPLEVGLWEIYLLFTCEGLTGAAGELTFSLTPSTCAGSGFRLLCENGLLNGGGAPAYETQQVINLTATFSITSLGLGAANIQFVRLTGVINVTSAGNFLLSAECQAPLDTANVQGYSFYKLMPMPFGANPG
jgi:hypothetical protein